MLRKHHLYAKLRKCSFYERHIHYFGHIISEEGITVDPEKIKSIKEWEMLRNVTEVRFIRNSKVLKNIYQSILIDCTFNYISAEEKCVI
jgi:hypothetical protein